MLILSRKLLPVLEFCGLCLNMVSDTVFDEKLCFVVVNCKYLIIHSPQGFLNNLQHWLGDFNFSRLLKVQFKINEGMSNDAPVYECQSEINHYTGHYVPYSLQRVCGFFNVPQIYYMCKGL